VKYKGRPARGKFALAGITSDARVGLATETLMRFVLTLIGLMFVCDLIWWSLADRILRPLRRARLCRTLLAVFMAAQLGFFATMILGRMTSGRTDELVPRTLIIVAFLWHFILLPVAILLAFGDGVVQTVRSLRTRWMRAAGPPSSPPGPADDATAALPSRRQFMRAAVVVATPPVATFVTAGVAMAQLGGFRINRVDIRLPQLPEALEGLNIAQVSDIHIGRLTSDSFLRRVVEATNALRSDLVLLTGDLIDHSLGDLPAGLDVVKRLDARHGVFMCEGNHDLFEGRRAFEDRVKRAGVPLLVNESITLSVRGQDVQLLGLCWGSTSQPDPHSPRARGDQSIIESMKQLLPQRQAGAFPILLAHHPHAFDVAAESGIPLTLSGHTHGGQLMASQNLGFGPLMFRYWSGLYQKNQSQLFVSNGVGNWFPLRINAPAEIVHITLRRG
jgi:predicted MPP superfamily phosphohydrolase